MKDFDVHAQIKHLNIRKQGEEQEVLAVDIKLNAEVFAHVLDGLMCEGINEGSAHDSFWSGPADNTEPAFPQLGDIPFAREYRNVRAKLLGFEVDGCVLKKFSFVALSGHRADLTFSLAITEPPAKMIDMLASALADSVLIQFSAPQGDLLEAEQKAA